MNFNLTEDQQAFKEAARAFAQKAMAPYAAQWDLEHCFPVETIKEAGDMGFCGLYTPEDKGGMGLSRLDTSVIVEELAAACPSTAAYITIHNMVSWMVASFAQTEVADELAPKLASGEWLGSYCLTEPGAGSDAASLRSKAVRDGDTYLIDGSKMFISGAGSTQLLIVMARTGRTEDGARGISAFIVPADSPGISYGKCEDKLGWNSQPTRQITFEQVRIPEKYRLGNDGEGFKFAMKGLDGGRVNIATCSLGAAQAAITQTRQYIQERKQFGRAIADFQSAQFKLADMTTDLTAARQMVRLAAFKMDEGHAEAPMFCAMAKRFATDACFQIIDDALQLHGGYGYIREYPIERYLRDARVHRILEGTNEIMRLIIARRVMEEGILEALS